jgi:MFS family permease
MPNEKVRPDDNPLLVRAIIASHFAPPFMFSGVAVALPDMAGELGAGATALSLVETLFLAANLAFLLPAGRLADASDKRSLYKFGLFIFGLSSCAIGLLSSITAILALRLIQGLASSILSATAAAILADIVPPHRRGRAFGGTMGAAYAGLTLGPICAGKLVEWWGWRAVFLLGSAILLAGFVLVQSLMSS